MSSQPKELREAYAQFDASHPWPTLHEAYIHAWHAAIAALGAQKPVAYVGKNSQLFSVALHDSLAEAREGSAGYSLLKELRPLFAAPVLPSVQEPVAYLHYAAKKPSLRELSFSADPNALQVASGWKSKPLFAAAPSPQEDKP